MKAHFIGIGGIGISALAQYYFKKGWHVSGSDLSRNETINILAKKGITISIGTHSANNLPTDANLVVYSPAISKNNPELKKAKKLKIKCKAYPEVLGFFTKKYFTIAVSGTHGKSTTSSMIALLLIKSGFDPTVIVGTKLKEFGGSNFRMGKSKYLVIEADEYKSSFLNYFPNILVLTNIEEDHLDYFGSLKNILTAFGKYFKNIKREGTLIFNEDDKNSYKLIESVPSFINIKAFSHLENKKRQLRLMVPGDHNILNALATWKVGEILKIPQKKIINSLNNFNGVWRRFEILRQRPFILVSDYAHHPTEIHATLKAARQKWPKKEIWCVFQPHQYQRLMHFFDQFAKSFAAADKIILVDVFSVAGREKKSLASKFNSKKLAEKIKKQDKNVTYIPSLPETLQYLTKQADLKKAALIIMGAGDIYKLAVELQK